MGSWLKTGHNQVRRDFIAVFQEQVASLAGVQFHQCQNFIMNGAEEIMLGDQPENVLMLQSTTPSQQMHSFHKPYFIIYIILAISFARYCQDR